MKIEPKYKIDVSLVIPVHNAEQVIETSMHEYTKFLTKYRENEIIIVCNACSDETAEVARKFAANHKNIKVIDIPERGKGLAVITGFNEARNEIIGFLDADNAFKLDSIEDMIYYLANHKDCDCAIASKWLGRNVFIISEPFTRKILAVGWKALILLLFHMRFHDTQAGCKFLKKKAFDALDKNFICKGFDFDVELLYKLKKKGFNIKEFNIPVSKVFKFSTFRLKYVPIMFWNMFKLWSKSIGKNE